METEELVRVCRQAASLKAVPRTGWVLATGVGGHESVADHSWGVALVSLLLAECDALSDQKINIEKVLKMAILHDLPEAIISDIPQTAVDHAREAMNIAKHLAEASALRQIVGPSETGNHLRQVWEEYRQGEGLEARIVSAADVIDMLVYASVLERAGVSPSQLDQFYVSAGQKLDSLRIEAASELYSILNREHLERVR